MKPRPQAKNWTPGGRFFALTVGDHDPLLFRHPTPFRAAQLYTDATTMDRVARADVEQYSARMPDDPSADDLVKLWRLRAVANGASSGFLIHMLWAHPEQSLEAMAKDRETTVDAVKSTLRRARSAFRDTFLALAKTET